MSVKRPTPQGISALLRKAGFQRSDYGDTGVMWNEVSPGYTVWKSRHFGHPGQPYVCVMHVIGGEPSGDWDAEAAECKARLAEYAEVIRAAGFAASVRARGDGPPWLTILTNVTGTVRQRL